MLVSWLMRLIKSTESDENVVLDIKGTHDLRGIGRSEFDGSNCSIRS